MRVRNVTAAVAAGLAVVCGATDAVGAVNVELHGTPPGTVPFGIAGGPDGAMYVGDSAGSAVLRVDPDGTVVPVVSLTPGMRPAGIALGGDGQFWVTEYDGSAIATVTTDADFAEYTGRITRGHPLSIAEGPGPAMWFTEIPRGIGRIDRLGRVTEFVTGLGTGAIPVGIVRGADGAMWFTDRSGAVGRITADGAITEFTRGLSPGAAPGPLTVSADGTPWFAQSGPPAVGRIAMDGTSTIVGALPDGWQPHGIAVGPDGNLWVGDGIAPHVGRMTPDGVLTVIPTGQPQVPGEDPAGQFGLAAGPDATIWFTATDNHVGRITYTPVVDATPAEGLTATGATIRAAVTTEYTPVTVRVEFGRDGRLGGTSASQVLPASTTARTVRVPLTGLTPSTIYLYRVVATSPTDTTRGELRAFITPPPPGDTAGGGAAPPGDDGAPGTGTATGAGGGTPGAVLVTGASVRVDRRGALRLRVRCPAGHTGPCRGVVRVRIGAHTVRGRFTVPAGRVGTAVVRLTPFMLRRARHRVGAAVTVGNATTALVVAGRVTR